MFHHTVKALVIFIILNSAAVFAQDLDMFTPTTTLGGYGELHYNSTKPENGKSTNILDFHRFVLFVGHSWSEKWSFKSEIEIEHNYVRGGQGELSLEQAYVDYHMTDYIGFQAGVLLVSAGLINEYHEPTLFFGVERPEYHKNIIPTTWFGNGAAAYGNYGGFDYKLSVMEGLNSEKFSASSGIRNGRQKGFEANANNFLYNGRVDYIGINGLRFGASVTYNKAEGDSTTNAFTLAEVHAHYSANNIIAAAEYGTIAFEKGTIENAVGYYADFGYNLGGLFNISTDIIPFIRYSDYNTAASVAGGGDLEKAHHYTQWMAGVSVKPLSSVVIKADIGEKTRELGNQKSTLFNLGVGYVF